MYCEKCVAGAVSFGHTSEIHLQKCITIFACSILGRQQLKSLRHFNPDVLIGRAEFAADLFLDVSAVQLPVEELL
jgi:hypothetical protein